jgi:hypothetical protein
MFRLELNYGRGLGRLALHKFLRSAAPWREGAGGAIDGSSARKIYGRRKRG